ncbi:epidermal retinol dehydrogenase 2-like [Styela clava]|uniref:epidermal retinol dehydrogenase 2-like n=1 Tax=Styela clava TaxID=7725 RepID=UPI001939FC5F|nr:epidermal retinol dehydrogenase 2-like [Styela clava]
MGFEIVLNLLWMLVLVIYYQLEAIVKFFIQPSRKDVSGQVVLVTGAGSGIGQRLSVEFAKLGCTIVGWDVSQKNLNETSKVMEEETGKEFYAYTCDLSDREAIYKTAEKVKQDIGRVDILINNAGIVSGKTILKCSDSMMQKTMEVNTMAHFWTLKAFLPEMLERNEGHVVTISSGAGYFGVPGQVDYAASKFGAVGMCEALHQELQHTGKTGVNVTCVCPYYINTGMFEGVKTSFMPILEKDDAVARIIDAILRNQYLLMLPKMLYLFAVMKSLLPTKALLVVGKYTGVNAAMDDFIGRKKVD